MQIGLQPLLSWPMEGNTEKNGNIKTDRLAFALMQHPNTPVCGIDKSPVELALGDQ